LKDRLKKIADALEKGEQEEAARLGAEFEVDAQRLAGFEPPGAELARERFEPISNAELERDVLEEMGITDLKKIRSTPGGKLQPERFDVGNFGHEHAEALTNIPHGLDKEVTIRLHDGTVRRLDRVGWNNPAMRGAGGIIYEVKPNTPFWIARGQQQGELYAHYMHELYGGQWQVVVVPYDVNAVRNLVRDLRLVD
jgi:hypothetical protein